MYIQYILCSIQYTVYTHYIQCMYMYKIYICVFQIFDLNHLYSYLLLSLKHRIAFYRLIFILYLIDTKLLL